MITITSPQPTNTTFSANESVIFEGDHGPADHAWYAPKSDTNARTAGTINSGQNANWNATVVMPAVAGDYVFGVSRSNKEADSATLEFKVTAGP